MSLPLGPRTTVPVDSGTALGSATDRSTASRMLCSLTLFVVCAYFINRAAGDAIRWVLLSTMSLSMLIIWCLKTSWKLTPLLIHICSRSLYSLSCSIWCKVLSCTMRFLKFPLASCDCSSQSPNQLRNSSPCRLVKSGTACCNDLSKSSRAVSNCAYCFRRRSCSTSNSSVMAPVSGGSSAGCIMCSLSLPNSPGSSCTRVSASFSRAYLALRKSLSRGSGSSHSRSLL
mmetsp:Transcript_15751/g.42917  ORF Transcript_15751/g.42917 Transcript_15751/m.42917 type:complete len:229 (+) Transcript_15751:2515-3201(+)